MEYKLYDYSIKALQKELIEWQNCKEYFEKTEASSRIISDASTRIRDIELGIEEFNKLQRAMAQT